MDNLKVKSITHHAFSIPEVDQAVYVHNLLFIRAGPSVFLYRELDEWITIAHRIDHIEYHAFLNALVARNNKELIIVDLGSKKEVIISLPDEYIIQCWNPAQDRFVFVDNHMNIHLAYVDMEKKECVVTQVYNLLQKAENSFINIGWGSEKTQFRGSEGKRTEDKEDEQEVAKVEEEQDMKEKEIDTSEEKKDVPKVVQTKEKGDSKQQEDAEKKGVKEVASGSDESITLEMIRDIAELNREDDSLQIAWSAMGDIFTVSYLFQGMRYYKSFDSDLNFLNELESKPDMGKNMAWKPDSSYLVVECNNKDRKILFFEKSGLYYREQKLMYPDPIERISWNANQKLLLIWQANEQKTAVSIWSAYTSTWIMKQCLTFDHSDHLINDVSWFDDNVQIITDSYLYVYSFILEQDRTRCMVDTDKRTGEPIIQAVAHIDGFLLNISIFEEQILPPPLYSYQIKMDRPMRQVMFGSNTNTLAVIYHDFTINVYSFSRSSYKVIEKHPNVVPSGAFLCYNFVYDDLNMQILSCGRTPDTAKQIVTYNLLTQELTFSHELEDRFHPTEKHFDLVPVATTEKDKFYFALLKDCKYAIYQNFEGHSTRFIESDYVWSNNLGSSRGSVHIARVDNVLYSFYKEESKLYLNGMKVHNKVTSMIFDQEFLLLTTMTDHLIAITVNMESLMLMQKGDFDSFFTRSIPSKSVILCMIPAQRQVVLYLINRDETEVITPRIMSISKIDKLLDEKKHISAYRIARSDRINLNVLYDMKPKRFIDDIEDFVRNVLYVEMIDQFLLSLDNDDSTTCKLYGYVVNEMWKIPDDGLTKKQRISNYIIAAMKAIDQPYYLQSIVTAYHILGTVEGLKLALIELFQARILFEKKKAQYRKTPSAILQHFITVAQFDPLYEAALILDKIQITKWLLSLSHIDPMEYMPFLKEIETLPPNYRKYKIYMQVKDYETAFKFLLRSEKIFTIDTVGMIKYLLKKYNLYKLVIQYMERSSPFYVDVMVHYTQHMREEGRINEAGVVFLNLGKEYYMDAFQCFCEAANTKEAITVAKLIDNEPELRKTFVDLAKTLISLKRLQEAANIYEEILHNPEQAFVTLVAGEHWAEANYLATKYHRQDLITGSLLPGLAKTAKESNANLKSIKTEYSRLYTRLKKLREEKIDRCRKLGITELHISKTIVTGEALDVHDGLCDATSIVSSVSIATFISTSTSRQKKKLERKVVSTKEGSPYEVVGLLIALYNLIVRVQKLMESVTNSCTYLFMFPDLISAGVRLQKTFDELWNYIQTTKPKIWSTDITHVNLNSERDNSPTRLVHRQHLENIDYKFHHPPPEPACQWKLLFN